MSAKRRPTEQSIQKLAARLMKNRVIIPEGKSGEIEIIHHHHKIGHKLMLVNDRNWLFTGYPRCDYICRERTTTLSLYSEEYGTWMTDMPIELIQMHNELAKHAKGSVLIGGLGLGIVARMCALKTSVNRIVVVESNQDVINLVWPHVEPHLKHKAKVVCQDINEFVANEGDFDVALLDTWQGTGEMVWTGEVVPLRRRFGKTIPVIKSWQEEVMFNQMVRPLYRAIGLGHKIYQGIPHYYAFAKGVEVLEPPYKKVPQDLERSDMYLQSELVLAENSQNKTVQALLNIFLHYVGTEPWEQIFGAHWDEGMKRNAN